MICPDCNGDGTIEVYEEDEDGKETTYLDYCSFCQGEGYV